MKLLTITVPMYNVANYIEECLKSFLVPGAVSQTSQEVF